MFADDLERWEASIALVAEGGEAVSYAELARRADAFAARLGPTRKVLYLEAANTLDAVVAYVGALRGRHPVILAARTQPGLETRLCEAFQPEAVYHRDGEAWSLEDGPAGEPPHPDLAVMLSTSGSSGSPKVVRLSRQAVHANASQIAEFLEIAPGQRAITSLPMGYSYGLSVINSHLAAGATIVLTERSVTEPEFWDLVRVEEVTSLAGVPETYELFERLGLRDDPPPSLRTLTQAGGRMNAELVADYARWAAGSGVRFFSMYGQTEATARMAYLRPGEAERYADCIGQAVPSGDLRLVDERGRTIDVSGIAGELVYRGPNVMMGYAAERADLARGAELDELRTGDLAVRVDRRFFRIVGRNSRFSKIAGKRIGLDDLEALLRDRGVAAAVAGDDARLAIWPASTVETIDQTREFIADRCGLPASAVVVLPVGEPPKLVSGKTDYGAVLREAEALAGGAPSAASGGAAIAETYALALGRSKVDRNESFTSLGGDSLAYVQASIVVEQQLGFLPDGWEHMKIVELDRMADQGHAVQRGGFTSFTTDVLLRALAIMAVVLGHTPSLRPMGAPVKGGLLVLFLLAGYSLARFQRGALLAGRPQEMVGNFLVRVIVPYYLLVLALTPLSEQARLSAPTLLLFSNLAGEDRGPLAPFWFPEAMLQCLVIFGAVFLIPPLRTFIRRRPFASGIALVAAAMAAKLATPLVWKAPIIDGLPRSPDAWGYALAAGWAACFARTTVHRIALLALVTGFAAWDWGLLSSRHAYLSLGLAALLFIPRVTLPQRIAASFITVATASFFIYLTHMLVIQVLEVKLGLGFWPAVLVAAVALGVAAHRVWQFVLPRLDHLVQQFRSTGAAARSAPAEDPRNAL